MVAEASAYLALPAVTSCGSVLRKLCVSQFDRDYADFQLQVQSVFQCLRSLLDDWFSRPVSVSSHNQN